MSGSIQIERQDIASDIRALADLTGVSIAEAIANAVRAQLAIERVKADAILRTRKKNAKRILAELRRLPVKGRTLCDSDIYDAHGLPS